MQHRVDRLRAALAEQDLPAVLVGAPSNRRYLSGFSGSYGWLVVANTDAFILTDSRYRLQSANESPDFSLSEIVNPGRAMPDLVKEICGELGINRLGFEASHMSVAEHSRVAAALGDAAELVPTEGLVEGLRAIKDAVELAALRQAIAITDEVFEAVAPQLLPRSHRVGSRLDDRKGHARARSSASFSIIVGRHFNAARPSSSPW